MAQTHVWQFYGYLHSCVCNELSKCTVTLIEGVSITGSERETLKLGSRFGYDVEDYICFTGAL